MDDQPTSPQTPSPGGPTQSTAEEPLVTPQQETPLAYEETPIIEPHEVPPPSKNVGRGIMGALGMFLLFAVLFGVGVWLSGIVKNYLSQIPQEVATTTPTPQPAVSVFPRGATTSATPAIAGWSTYPVISGVTRLQIQGISFALPSQVLAPICDGTSCASQGTYLPGGTRFTIAPRGTGQVLKDFRGSVISDLRGQAFTVTQTTIAGRPAVAFQANFTGSTSGGSTFAQMRGVMIEVTDTLSLEVNHFTPTGLAADFAADDKVFDEILTKLSFSGTTGTSKGSTPAATPTGATQL